VPRTRPPYPEEFRREAIRLARLSDKAQRRLAKDLGISNVTLRHWLKEEKAARGERPGGLSEDEREELKRLRMRTRSCGWSGRSCEKRRSSSRGRTTGGRRGVLVHRRGEGELSRRRDVPRVRGEPNWVSQLGAPGAVGQGAE
jgi:transposase